MEVLAAHKAGVDVVSGERDGAELFEVEVKDGSVDGVQVRAATAQRVLCGGEKRIGRCLVRSI